MDRIRRWQRRAWLPVLCFFTLCSAGCELSPVRLQLPGYFSAGVQEVWFWRLDEATDQYVRSSNLRLEGLSGPPGRKVIRYTMVAPDGSDLTTLEAPVQVRGDSIIVELQYARWQQPGWFRVSSRNAVGESGLSDEEIFL